jgi:hypothetical protein
MEAASLKSSVGTWTRVNRHKPQEKSTIDYIICCNEMMKNLTNIEIDEAGNIRPKGTNETDHNTITAKFTIPISVKKEKITRWDINNTTNWEEYNRIINDQPEPQNYNQMENRIKTALQKVAKKKTITITNKPRLSDRAKQAKTETKTAKKAFEEESKNNGPNKVGLYEKYIEHRKKLKRIIEEDEKERINKISNQLVKEGGVKSKYFWKLRKKLISEPKENHDLITEDNQTISNEAEAKEEIAKYYEDLYQARQARNNYEVRTTEIENNYHTIKKAAKNALCKDITKKN